MNHIPTELIGVIRNYCSDFIVYKIQFNHHEKIKTQYGMTTISNSSYTTIYTTNENKINSIIQTNRKNNTLSIYVIKFTYQRKNIDTFNTKADYSGRFGPIKFFFELSSEIIAQHKYDAKKKLLIE